MDWKQKTIFFYALGGLALGIISGIITVNNAVEENKEVDLSMKNRAKIGLAALEVMKKTILK